MQEPIFFVPVFQERIWGGTRLRDRFGYQIPSEKTGECWAFSAHPHGQSVVRDGCFAGRTLGALWEHHRELFGDLPGDKFPLLTKILDANEDLSVQVHPGDEYARIHENGELGKTECWYIIDCKPGAQLIYGHRARTIAEARDWMAKGMWEEFLHTIDIRPGDFFFVPSGTIHALKAGTLVLETQQNSDTTYRLYDYGRRDSHGNLRELHVDKSLDVMNIPHVHVDVCPADTTIDGVKITTFVQSECFSVERWTVQGHARFRQNHPFQLVSVIEGTGIISTSEAEHAFRAGDHFLLPYGLGDFIIRGDNVCITSYV